MQLNICVWGLDNQGQPLAMLGTNHAALWVATVMNKPIASAFLKLILKSWVFYFF